MEFSTTTSLSIILAIGATLIGTCGGLKCYDCVSPKNDFCDIDSLSRKTVSTLDKIPTIECGDLPLCAKFKYSDGRVARGCSGSHSITVDGADPSDTCFANTANKDALACYCPTDYCNEAGSLKLGAAITLTPAIVILTYFLST